MTVFQILASKKEVGVSSSVAQAMKAVLNRPTAFAILKDSERRKAEKAATQRLKELINTAITQQGTLVDDSTGLALFEWRKGKKRSATIAPVRIQGGALKLVVSTDRYVDKEGQQRFKLKLVIEVLWAEGSWRSTAALQQLKLTAGEREVRLKRTSAGSFEAEATIALSVGRTFSVA